MSHKTGGADASLMPLSAFFASLLGATHVTDGPTRLPPATLMIEGSNIIVSATDQPAPKYRLRMLRVCRDLNASSLLIRWHDRPGLPLVTIDVAVAHSEPVQMFGLLDLAPFTCPEGELWLVSKGLARPLAAVPELEDIRIVEREPWWTADELEEGKHKARALLSMQLRARARLH